MIRRFLNTLFFLFLPLAGILLWGCATSPAGSKKPPHVPGIIGQEDRNDPFSGLAERYRVRAREHEKRGDLRNALRSWDVVYGFVPGDAEAGRKVLQLKMQIPAVADQHFHKGVAFFKNQSYAPARKEFIWVLYLKPDHAEAVQYLKGKLAGDDFLSYEVKKGDTLQGVARKIYKDPQKDFLIAYFNGLEVESPIAPPRILRMPMLDPFPPPKAPASAKSAGDQKPEKTVDIQDALAKARGAYRENNYQESGALSEKILEYDPANREARELMNASYYQLGKELGQGGKYQEALEAFERVDSGYQDTIAQLAQNKKEVSESHYINGVKFFAQEEIEMAIQEWESALTWNPKHPRAGKDIESARNLLEKLEKIK